MATLVELEARVRDLDLRVRAIEQEQAGNLRLSQAILAKVDLLAEDSRAGFAAVRNEFATTHAELADVHSDIAGIRITLESQGRDITAMKGAQAAQGEDITAIRSDIAEIKDILKGGDPDRGG